MRGEAWLLFAVASIIFSSAVFLLVQRRGFQSVHVKAGPVQMDLSAVELARKVDEVHAELKPNGGSSLRDAVDRIEARVSALEHVTKPPKET